MSRPYHIVMDKEMIERIDAVLERVKDPESMLSMAELGWVRKVRYDEVKRKLCVFTNSLGPGKQCRTVIAGLLLSSMVKSITKDLEKEFPNLSVEFV